MSDRVAKLVVSSIVGEVEPGVVDKPELMTKWDIGESLRFAWAAATSKIVAF
jgi:hypothetical protein